MTGLPDPQNYSTARDMATLAAHVIRNFPEYYHFDAEKEFTYHNIKQDNRNPLFFRLSAADGLKTGHTEAGGYGLMGSGTAGGRRVILVLNGLNSAKARAIEGARLLRWGLKSFRNVAVCKAGTTCEKLNVRFGTHRHVPAVEKDVLVTLPNLDKREIKPEVVYDDPLQPPIHKGDRSVHSASICGASRPSMHRSSPRPGCGPWGCSGRCWRGSTIFSMGGDAVQVGSGTAPPLRPISIVLTTSFTSSEAKNA